MVCCQDFVDGGFLCCHIGLKIIQTRSIYKVSAVAISLRMKQFNRRFALPNGLIKFGIAVGARAQTREEAPPAAGLGLKKE